MSLFRRVERGSSPAAGESAAIAEFWRRWADARFDVAGAIDSGSGPEVARLLDPMVCALHPDLRWETVPATTARHALVVSSGGKAELRTLTERWHRAGPAPDSLWEHHPSRPTDRGRLTSTVEVAGREIALAETVVSAEVDDARCRLDVAVYHPSFGDLVDEARMMLALTALDWALGEDDVERWVGRIETTTFEPLDEVPITGLTAVLSQLADRWGGERWLHLAGVDAKGRQVRASVRHPVRPVDHPLFDEHVVVRLPFAGLGADGLPDEVVAARLNAFEAHLRQRLGAAAVLVAHETHAGQRVLHLYDDSQHSVGPQIAPMLSAWAEGGARVETGLDPGWTSTTHLRP